ncbi:MAG: hypothetical protein IPL67_10705 [Ignavibacteria bacterium]|nr:hypothetical protein [Ignavibacteria bacterium]
MSTNTDYDLPIEYRVVILRMPVIAGSNLIPTEVNYTLTDFMIEAVASAQLSVDAGVSDIIEV